MSDRRIRFIERKGALEVLFEVERGEKGFTDIQENVEISSATLSNRLKEGKVEGLWKERLEESDDGSARRVYVITPKGRKLVDHAKEIDLPKFIEKLHEIQEETDRRISKLGGNE